eukprot:CAMPEP_0170492990 /NCGR_PEP_ID=MMETSP0208-20121228/13196_1 /TAXON_ID=197538 /ORGANISM="Strombidium inclinatum, Strain S3" /LENGTH=121 /DNA_ID=CAMNT_0010768843 /DNA_START=227 /DNA_END=592 /DNA_ORIENTATION=+
MEEWKQEMETIRGEIPDLEAIVADLKVQLALEKRKNFSYDLFAGVEGPDVTQLGYKLLVSKLSGFAKFELDTKINRFQFFNLLEELSQVEVTLEDPEGSGAITHGEPSHMDEQPPVEGEES